MPPSRIVDEHGGRRAGPQSLELDVFLEIASHELKTPVAVIKGSVQLLLRRRRLGDLSGEVLDRTLRVIEQASNRVTRLIDNMLEISGLDAGTLPLDVDPVDIVHLVRSVAERAPSLHSGSQQFRFESLIPSIRTQFDRARLEEVIDRIIDNAVKFSPIGNTVWICIEPRDADVLVSFRDEGIGVPADGLQSIFEPFGRAENAVWTRTPGMGLGLSLCRLIVERHDGRMWAESPGEDQGTTVFLSPPNVGGSRPEALLVTCRIAWNLTRSLDPCYCGDGRTNEQEPE